MQHHDTRLLDTTAGLHYAAATFLKSFHAGVLMRRTIALIW
jgi:hypothetical protein